ncbi:MAG: hypothetical protein E6K87_03990 [Thaumarchaeota archaeon]|nr:MAG: hypothetical protein E6K87_03990 [Nitrososphaerota archaeon]TLY06617.1 MAG: hypothetical protein E6K83_08120 [Nitrososphaerota archaeon]
MLGPISLNQKMGEAFDEKTLRKIEHRLVNRFGLSFEQSLVKPDKINAVLKELLKGDQFFESLTKSDDKS